MWSRVRLSSALLSAALLASAPAGAQALDGGLPTKDELARRLAGDGSRDWIKVRESVFMGDGRCAQGERWRFAANGALSVRTCVGGAWQVSRHRWRLEPDGRIDHKLVVSPLRPEGGRRLLFRGGQLVLRHMPAGKTRAIEDVILRAATGRPPTL